jgi:hypothetical protein
LSELAALSQCFVQKSAKSIQTAEINHQLLEVYGEGVVRKGNVGKGNMDTLLSSPSISKTESTITSVERGKLLLMSFLKFSFMFYNLSFTRLSHFNSNTEICDRLVTRILTDEQMQNK